MKQAILRLIRFAPPMLLCLLLVADATPGVAPVAAMSVQTSCSDSPNDCKLPVKYLGEKAGCACFACEYGKRTQRTICTRNKEDRAKMMAKIRGSVPRKSPSNKNVR